MKKLTAGIFATILGLTAVDAFAASNVASTKYVQGAIDSLATVAKTGDYNDLANTPDIPSIAGLATTEYVDQAETDAIAAAATAAEKYIDATELEASQTAQDTSLKAWVGEQGYVTTTQMGEQGFATTGDVATAKQAAIDAAAADATSKADAAQAAAIAAAATDATSKADAAQAAAIAAAATDATSKADAAQAAAIAAAATAAEKYIDATELEASQTAQDTSLKAWVGDQGYVTSGALEAEGFATTGYVDQAETDAIAAAATAAAQLYVPLTAVVDSYPDASLNQQGQ